MDTLIYIPFLLFAFVALLGWSQYIAICRPQNSIVLDEKTGLLPRDGLSHEALQLRSERERQRREHWRAHWRNYVFGFMVIAVLLGVFSAQYDITDEDWPLPQYPPVHKKPDFGSDPYSFDWTKVEPSPTLDWVRCYDSNECARLEVPLDWNSTTKDGPKAAIAVVKKPAVVEVIDPRYGGAILTNPGGPGGSGVQFHVLAADALRQILDPNSGGNVTTEEKYFDLISFDPRGIANTTPQTPGLDDVATWFDQQGAIGVSLKDREIFDRVFVRQKLYGKIVAEASTKDKHAGSFVSTAIVVRDMVQIIEEHGRWREQRAFSLLFGRHDEEANAAWNRTRWTPGEELLNYWGVSYGTFLGQTFATLQPHRVGRVLLDGVVDAADYAAGTWSKNLQDFDGITAAFAEHCVSAGPTLCPIASWAGPDNNTDIFISTMYAHIVHLKSDPIATYTTHTTLPSLGRIPQVTTYSDIMSTIFSLWYSPAVSFPFAATLLSDIARGIPPEFVVYHPPVQCPTPSAYTFDPLAAGTAIRCIDAGDQSNKTKSDFLSYLAEMQAQSEMFSDLWATVRMPCFGYTPPHASSGPPWRFAGPFGAKTRNPILFASTALDPVTPLRNAEFAAENLFEGAGVLVVVDGKGHSTFGWPSVCAARAIRRFFATGDVGDGRRTECLGDVDPFPERDGVRVAEVRALEGVGEAWRRVGMGLGHGLGHGLRHGLE